MSLQIIGLSHQTAPLEIREKLTFKSKDYLSQLKSFTDGQVIREALLISTCNRVELLFEGDEDLSYERALEFFAGAKDISPTEFAVHLYHYKDIETIRHLFRVAASLDSMCIGEDQISGQVREAYAFAAEEAGTIGRRLHKLMHHAFRAAKRVKSETCIGASGTSLSSAAVEEARRIFGSLAGKTVLLVGAGEMAELAAKYLAQRGEAKIIICNRTSENAVRLAKDFAGKAANFEELYKILPQADVVICSTAAPDYLITDPMVKNLQNKRGNCPQLFIDLSFPRNVAPEIKGYENVYLSDIDGLQKIAEANQESQKAEILCAEQIVNEETVAFWEYLPVTEKGEIMSLLRETMNNAAQREFERSRSCLGDLSAEQTAAIEQLLHRTVAKIAHPILYSIGRTRHAAAMEFAEILYTMLGQTGSGKKATSERLNSRRAAA